MHIQFPWLVYSKQENGGFCLPCVLLTSSENCGSDPSVFVNSSLTAFTKALEILRKHTEKGYHHAISIPLLTTCCLRWSDAFQQTALLGLSVVPSVMVSLSAKEYTTKLSKLTDMYRDNLPYPDCIISELKCWQLKWQQQLREHGQSTLPGQCTK